MDNNKIRHKDSDTFIFGHRMSVGNSSESITLTALYRTISRRVEKEKSRIPLKVQYEPRPYTHESKSHMHDAGGHVRLHDWTTRAYPMCRHLVRAY